MSMRENRNRIVIDPISFFILLAAGLVTVFHIVEFRDPEVIQVSLFLVLSLALMGLLRPELRLNTPFQKELIVVVAGLYSAVGLLLAQLIFLPFSYSTIQVALYAAIAEEAFFSGFAYTGLRRVMPEIHWSLVSLILSLAFASLHVLSYNLTVFVFLVLVLGRVILFVALEKTGYFGAPLLGHLLVNIFASNIDYSLVLDVVRFVAPLLVVFTILWWWSKR